MGMMEKMEELTSTGVTRIPDLQAGSGRVRNRHPEGAGNSWLRTSDPRCQRAELHQRRESTWNIVPIVDLRLKFNCSKAEYNTFTVVIISTCVRRIVGVVVDSVSEMELPPEKVLAGNRKRYR